MASSVEITNPFLNERSSEPTFHSIADYVERLGGTKVVDTILIANNGIAAVKAIRSIRKWAYSTLGNERAIQFVVMATPEDLAVNAEYIRMADQVEEVPGGSNANNYANVDLIVEIAERRGVHAVWAGWGHASENPRLPDTLSRTNIAFMGPPAKAMRDLGDKIASTLVAQSANVSCVPWNGSEIKVNYAVDGIEDSIYQKACVQTVEEAVSVVNRIGLPVMVKASEGGGGKGIRKVHKQEDLEAAYRQVQGEVPGSPIFIMKMVNNARHIEVQVIGDQYGEAIALYGRDCSVQRRHQKIIEEGPAIAAPTSIFTEMEQAAVRMARAVGYVGAGTIEYLFDEKGNYYFLELNPRLQVEHPVTELVTGVNLPATQLNIAMGIKLERIPDIRRFYGQDPYETTNIDLHNTPRLPPKGHVIAARITGENPDEGFKPTSGGISELTFRSTPNVWGYFSVGPNGGLHEYADSQFGHIFSRGSTREEARKELIIGLKELSIRGDISTPIAYVTYLLETETFKNNQVTTAWLDRLIADDVHEEKPNSWLVVLCGCLYQAHHQSTERYQKYLSLVDRGQIPEKEYLSIKDDIQLIYMNTKYSFVVRRSGANSFTMALKGNLDQTVEADVRPLGDSGLLILMGGKSHVCYGNSTAAGLKIILDGRTCFFTKEYDPSQLRSTTSGKLVRYLVENGSHVKTGTPYAEMEVMKMYLPLIVSEPGKIRFVQTEGNIIEVGSLIATIELDDPSKVQRATLYTGALPEMKPPAVRSEKCHQVLREAMNGIRKTLAGYYNANIKQDVQLCFQMIMSPQLPLLEFQESLSRISSRLPKNFVDALSKELSDYKSGIENNKVIAFNGSKIRDLINKFADEMPKQKQKEFQTVAIPLVDLCGKFENGLTKNMEDVLAGFLKEYITVESYYQHSREILLASLRQTNKDSLKKVYEIEIAHSNLVDKNKLVLMILEMVEKDITPYAQLLTEMSDLMHLGSRDVAFKARRMLTMFRLPSFAHRKDVLEKQLASTEKEKLGQLVTQPLSIFDALVVFMFGNLSKTSDAAIEVYLRRAYQAYTIKEIIITGNKAEWWYSPPKKSNSDEGYSPVTMMKKINTDIDLLSLEQQAQSASNNNTDRIGYNHGVMYLFNEDNVFSQFSQKLNEISNSNQLQTILKVGISLLADDSELKDDQVAIKKFTELFQANATQLRTKGIRRVTVFLCKYGKFPKYFTFRERLGYNEHPIYRHLEPPLAFQLELSRLSNYEIQLVPTVNRRVHLYYADERERKTDLLPHCPRLFTRSIIRGTVLAVQEHTDYLIHEAENVLSEACNALELALHNSKYKDAINNHIFMNFIPEVVLSPDKIRGIIGDIAAKYEKRLGKARVGEVELIGRVSFDASKPPTVIRFIATNPTTYKFNIDAYVEVVDSNIKKTILRSVFSPPGPYDGRETEPYALPSLIERKRVLAHQNTTTYVYDFMELFGAAVRSSWLTYSKERSDRKINIPKVTIESTELVLNASGELEEISRAPGQNNIGMVAWKAKLYTPEYPQGRYIIVLANDITYQIGSFGPQEDLLFKKVSELARNNGFPRIYMAANSGARIGLAEEVKSKFQVSWVDNNDPTKGFNYLYLNDEEYGHLARLGSVNAKKLSDNCWMITDIIGSADGLGVENLKGSGMIAGETSRAYEETFTLTIVTGRTVGIGAYLVRLGQRTIQNKGPVILTGASALNKVLGRNVYTSNVQLGGTQIMFANGVSHLIVNDEIEGIVGIINWLSYVPCQKGAPVPMIDTVDPIDREIEFVPTKAPYDPRHMIAGYHDNVLNKWVSGFFDKDSFTETLAGWGKTVVVGRARLGGIPIGLIAVETRTVERVNPADPAFVDTKEMCIQQAGQVWFPDSAYKTAQAIQDFNNGEELPLIIFANWRGFSGGLRDLYEEILKFGSFIVDNLRNYKQPVFIYIPPCGELRGGAWVVVDPQINPSKMEMYCDENGRGGVLEPNGTVEIKFKAKDVIKTMNRIDGRLQELNSQLLNPTNTKDQNDLIKSLIISRQNELQVTYEQVAISFADLHDTPGRMKAKGCIREVLSWKNARKFFYFRVKRRLLEEYLLREIKKSNLLLSDNEAEDLIKSWVGEAIYSSDKDMSDWLEKEKTFVSNKISELKQKNVKDQVVKSLLEDPSSAVDGLLVAMEKMSEEQKKLVLSKLVHLK